VDEPNRRRDQPALSEGNGVVAQFLNFIWEMSDGNGVQKTIALFLPVILPAMILVAAVFIVLFEHGLPWVGGASVVGVGATAFGIVRRQRRSKATVDEPRDQSGGAETTAHRDEHTDDHRGGTAERVNRIHDIRYQQANGDRDESRRDTGKEVGGNRSAPPNVHLLNTPDGDCAE
jgi:hypothetical protein